MLRGRTLTVGAKRRVSTGAAAIRRHAVRTWRTLVAHVRVAATTLASTGRTVARRCHRYRTATAAMSVAAVVVARNGLRGTATGLGASLGTGAASLWGTVEYGLGRATDRLRGLADVVASTVNRFAALGRRLANAGRSSE
jgi:hypothetical protein